MNRLSEFKLKALFSRNVILPAYNHPVPAVICIIDEVITQVDEVDEDVSVVYK
jgi:hypothetical protein